METNRIIEKLIEILERKREVVNEVLKLTISQGNLIKQGELENLSEAIEEKQALINEVNDLDLAFLERYQHIKTKEKIQSIEELDLMVYPAMAQVKALVGNIMTLLKRVEEVDKVNQENLNKDFDVLKEEMNKLKTGQQNKKIMSTYTKKYADVQGVFIDNKNKY